MSQHRSCLAQDSFCRVSQDRADVGQFSFWPHLGWESLEAGWAWKELLPIALSNLFSKLLQEVDSPRLPKSKGKRKGYSMACVSSSFFLAPSTKSRLRPAGVQQAGHVPLAEALSP